METVTSADGTEIAFERTGNGPPLVLVHGNGDVHTFWDLAGARPALADHCTVYAIERRGRGESGDAAEYRLEQEAEDVVAVINTIDEPVVVVGHSGGALYSLEATLRTSNLRTLILNEPPIMVRNHELGVAAGIAEMNRLLDDGDNEKVLVFFLQEVAGLTPAELDTARASPTWQQMVDAAHTLPRELQAIEEYEFDSARFEEMTAPTLLMIGSESPPLFEDAIEALNDALPNSKTVTFDGHQHEPMNTAPDDFVDEVLTFIRKPN
ncbi:alpha/beta fold hydrolase [Natrialba sp. SSL1]|uniref:alpha/beta fold hydrolase n=1 Tax=Natrialba sp. SSL1 TaxID=1869245 RepID=UPI0008F83509|nr:alpha/beta hydrolase [Natrialba sp. SSL1]OIB55835.1 alpha/beta hydrolase [Natrialba sp. SSL1]